MAESPSINSDKVVESKVYCDGKALDDSFELVYASVRLTLNKIGKATLKFNAASMEGQSSDESDSDSFKPGGTIRLDVGYIDSLETIFEGVIVDVGLKIGKGYRSQMVVECRDVAYAATQGRKNRLFEKKRDSEMIKEVLSDYGSVKVDSTDYAHPEMMQYYSTDWDFARSRADVCGLYIYTKGSDIIVAKPTVSGSAVLSVTYGVDLIDFDVALSDSGIYSKYEAVSWDRKDQKLVSGSASAPSLNKQGDLTEKQIAGDDTMLIQSDAPTDAAALKAWADSIALRAGLARYRGRFSFYGSAKVEPNTLIELKGLGKRFNGNAFVGSVTHTIERGSWITSVGLGIETGNITEEVDVVAPPASGLLPGIEGVHTATVKKADGDPLSENRIQVELPWLDGDKKELWARLCTPYSTSEAGIFFLPEVGDEVLVGFVNQDPSHPIILGSLHNGKVKPPLENDAKNNTKGIITREKLTITLDDEKKIITIETPAKNRVEISDEGKSITLADQNKNEIVMDSSGIALTSAKDITLTAKGGITLDATTKIALAAKQDVTIEGLNFTAQAKVGATVKGNATAELSASGQTTVKGAMVMIN
ncbi:MAG: type VI secretion system tip protein VgrG [Rikenellaceae bacterium]